MFDYMYYFALSMCSLGSFIFLDNIKSCTNKQNIFINKNHTIIDDKYYELQKITAFSIFINILIWSTLVFINIINNIGLYCALFATIHLLCTYILKIVSIKRNYISNSLVSKY